MKNSLYGLQLFHIRQPTRVDLPKVAGCAQSCVETWFKVSAADTFEPKYGVEVRSGREPTTGSQSTGSGESVSSVREHRYLPLSSMV